jgi:hypothetical protein
VLELVAELAALSNPWVCGVLNPTAANYGADAFCLGFGAACCCCATELVALPGANTRAAGIPQIWVCQRTPPATGI